MKTLKASFILRYVLAMAWEKQQIQVRVTQGHQEIFLYDILRLMTREHLPTIVYLEQVKHCYCPCYLEVRSNNNNFMYMEM
jgi:hypothetical protein